MKLSEMKVNEPNDVDTSQNVWIDISLKKTYKWLNTHENLFTVTSTPIITLSMAHPPIYQTTQCSLFSYLVSWTTPCYILKYEYLDLSASEENTGPVSKSQRNREIDMRLCVLGKGPPLSNNLIRCNPFPVLETLFDDKRYLVGAVSSLFGNFMYTTLM